MQTEFDIKALFGLIWNYRAAPYPMIMGPEAIRSLADRRLPRYDGIMDTTSKTQSDLGVDFYGKNLLGLEVFMPITLEDETGKTKLQLENTVMTISLKKTIIETPLVNRQGTVKEEISIDDWMIDIKGIIVSKDNVYYNSYPDREVKKLKDMVFVGNSLKITNALTAICLAEDEKIVIRDIKFPDMKGVENAQAFEINCVSDLSFELTIK